MDLNASNKKIPSLLTLHQFLVAVLSFRNLFYGRLNFFLPSLICLSCLCMFRSTFVDVVLGSDPSVLPFSFLIVSFFYRSEVTPHISCVGHCGESVSGFELGTSE